MKKEANVKRLVKHIVLILGAIIMLVPFIWMFLTAFKTETEATQMNPFVILPSEWRTDGYQIQKDQGE